MRRTKVIVLSILILLILPMAVMAQDEQTADFEKALQYINQTYNTPMEKLKIVNVVEASFPVSGQKLWAIKIRDFQLDRVHGVYMQGGNIVDINEVGAREKEAYAKKYGKLEPDLYDYLQQMRLKEKVKVGIWLTAINSSEIEKTIIAKYSNLKLIGIRPSLDTDMEVYKNSTKNLAKLKKKLMP